MYNPALDRRDGRVVEGTPLLREHTPKKCIEGSNPSLSASYIFVTYSLSVSISPLRRLALENLPGYLP